MRPEDERRDDAAGDEPVDREDEGAAEGPPPATWAGRRRAGLEPDRDEGEVEEDEVEEPDVEEPDEGEIEELVEADTEEPVEGELQVEEPGEEPDEGEIKVEEPGEEPEEAGEPEDGPGEPEDGPGDPEDGPGDPEDGPGDPEDDVHAPVEVGGGTADPGATQEFDPLAGELEHASDEHELEEPSDEHQLDEDEDEGEGEEEDPTDAALAAVRARAAEHEVRAETGSAEASPAEASPAETGAGPPSQPAADDDAKAPHAKRIWARFLAASLVIVISMAAATSISLLVYLTDIAEGLGDNDALASLRDQLADVDGGSPQTILILGSDKRLHTQGDAGRSDTTLLLRVDPEKDRIALLSIPRDLKVTIPGYGVGKFNEAYTVDGPDLTTRVVKQLTGLEINHVVNINFTGFADAVNAIDCVYVDVDRNYFIPPELNVAEIDIQAGYQRLCGLKALQYVRFRHDDNDLVRSARQQDFLREARQKLPPGTLVRDRNELLDIFTEYTTSDIGEAVPLLELLKTFASVQSATVREVHFPADLGDGTSTYVTASDEAIKQTVREFLDTEGTPGERPAGEADAGSEKPHGDKSGDDKKKPQDSDHFEGPPMDDATAIGQQYAEQLSQAERKDGDPMIDFPIFYPTRLTPGSALNEASRAFPIDGPDDDLYHGYKMVARFFGPGGYYEYYGVSGTDWVDAPILANPSETRTIDGRDYLLFYDGDRLRLVGWKTGKAAYWVNNTLLQALEEGEMLSVATSMRELGK
ncbi:MAG: hypothetical protein GEU88_13375 [Solirubrobacterales bacterium]|nr:hypothetical protein [Solirubrobacterales bacterium]